MYVFGTRTLRYSTRFISDTSVVISKIYNIFKAFRRRIINVIETKRLKIEGTNDGLRFDEVLYVI